MTEWQPIETAPKDGTAVMLFSTTWPKEWGDVPVIGKAYEVIDYETRQHISYGWQDVDGCAFQEGLTHWMPLPEPPK